MWPPLETQRRQERLAKGYEPRGREKKAVSRPTAAERTGDERGRLVSVEKATPLGSLRANKMAAGGSGLSRVRRRFGRGATSEEAGSGAAQCRGCGPHAESPSLQVCRVPGGPSVPAGSGAVSGELLAREERYK